MRFQNDLSRVNSMLYREVDSRLDMQLTISMEQTHPIIPLLQREMSIIPLDTLKTEEGSFIDLFICGETGIRMEGSLFPFKPEKMGECLIVRIRAEEMEMASDIINRLSEIPSALRVGFYLKGRRIYAEYRFHHTDLEMISNVGKKISDMKNSLRIEDLGPCSGGISKFDEVNSRIHLGVVAYQSEMPQSTGLPDGKSTDYLIEYMSTPIQGMGLKVVIYNDGEYDSENTKTLGNGINLRYVKSPFLDTLWKHSSKVRLPRAAILTKFEKGTYRTFIFLPLSMMDSQISILYDMASNYPEAKFRLLGVRAYQPDIWNWV